MKAVLIAVTAMAVAAIGYGYAVGTDAERACDRMIGCGWISGSHEACVLRVEAMGLSESCWLCVEDTPCRGDRYGQICSCASAITEQGRR